MIRKRIKKRQLLKKKKRGEFFLYLTVIIFSVLFLFLGNKIATNDLPVLNGDYSKQTIVTAKIEKITDRSLEEYSLDENNTNKIVKITFDAMILSGAEKGKKVAGIQSIGSIYIYDMNTPEVKKGDKILLLYNEGQEEIDWQFVEFVRTDKLLVFGILFVFALLLFGHIKGFNTLLSLVFTCGAIFAVFIPSILSGKNIYLSSIIICLYTILMTYLIVNGFNKKTLSAILGCFGGIFISGILTIIMDKVLALTGYVNEESGYLFCVSTEAPIDLKAIIFAAILIGAMGAIMDVSMSISSSLWEVKNKSDYSSFNVLFKSGMNIGRDVMGTMANTLILAYIGSSLSVVLLLSIYSTSLIYLLNQEMIVVEIIQALVGSFGILFTIPLTSLICAAIYNKDINENRARQEIS